VVVNKTDLLPYVDFDVDRLAADARKVQPGLEILCVSARTGDNMDAWQTWLDHL
jgi:hydrogenase nickel incorporation protein HypB